MFIHLQIRQIHVINNASVYFWQLIIYTAHTEKKQRKRQSTRTSQHEPSKPTTRRKVWYRRLTHK